MRVVLIKAGTNEPSNASVLADAFIEGIPDAQVDVVTLKDMQIDHFTLDCYKSDYLNESDFLHVQGFIQQAHGLVIATPIWNFGVPAHLKNLIDRMGSFGLDSETRSKGMLKGLPFFLIFTGGAPMPAWKGLMRKTSSYVAEALQYFGASFIGHHYEPKCTIGRGKFGLVVDQRPESIAVIREKGSAFASVVTDYERTGKAPAKNRLRDRVMRLGERVLKNLG